MNVLLQSIQAWNNCQSFLASAKATVREEDALALQWCAARERARHECAQALYWVGVKP